MIRGTLLQNRTGINLIQAGATVNVHDPYVEAYSGVPLLQNLDDAMKGADAIVIFAGHNQYKNLDPKTIRKLFRKSTSGNYRWPEYHRS